MTHLKFLTYLTYCWFSHDVTKIHTTKLSILPRFYLHDVLEQLKTNFHTNFRFKRVLDFVIDYAWICKLFSDAAFTWRPRKHFFGCLVYETFRWPESWRGSSHIYLLSFPRFWTLSIERCWFLFWSILNGVTLKTSNMTEGSSWTLRKFVLTLGSCICIVRWVNIDLATFFRSCRCLCAVQ